MIAQTPLSSPSLRPASKRGAASARALALIGYFACVGAVQAVIVAVSRGEFNVDAISYIQVARHWRAGQWSLAVNGYWGPLMSWMIAPLGALLRDDLLAARAIVAASQMFFLAACLAVFRRLFRLTGAAFAVAAAAAAVYVSGQDAVIIAPDSMLAALLCLGTLKLFEARLFSSGRAQAMAGALFALAYLAKAIALPVFALLWPLAFLLARARGIPFPKAARATGRMILAWLAIVLLWIVPLSVKYRRPTFSTTGPIAHAIAGPPDRPRSHAAAIPLALPPPGRMIVGEDPSNLPYAYWSPLASRAYALHQVRLARDHFAYIVSVIGGYDALACGRLGLVFGFIGLWASSRRSARWRWSIWVVVANVALYLPVYAVDARYYRPIFPFVVGAGIRFILDPRLYGGPRSRLARRTQKMIGLAVVALAVVAPQIRNMANALDRRNWRLRSEEREIASLLAELGRAGAIAGVGSGRLAAVVSFFGSVPCAGERVSAEPDQLAGSGARVVFAPKRSPLADALARDPRFLPLDAELADAAARRGLAPLQVLEQSSFFAVTRPAALAPAPAADFSLHIPPAQRRICGLILSPWSAPHRHA